MQKVNFFVESIKNLKTVGTLAPCSPAAVKKMVKPVDFNKTNVIVELGGGTGAVTKEILKAAKPGTKIFVFETNPNFVKVLKELGGDRLGVINDSAVNMPGRLKSFGLQKTDYVISTLPLALMDNQTKEKIFDGVNEVLQPGGYYVQIQYSLISKKEIDRKFHNVKLDFTPFNFPPAFFYICERGNNR